MHISKQILLHCLDNGIEIRRLSTGAVRFVGAGVDVTVADGTTPKLEILKPYQARKGRNLRNI